MINPHRIKFQKIFSNELNIPDLIMECAFDSDSSEVSTYLNREAVSIESHDGRYSNTIRYKYSERFSPKFTFIKKGFGDFDMSELRTVLKWLTSSDTPTLLDVYYDDSNVVGFSAIGNWTEVSSYKLANSRTVAVVATFESIHPFALSDLYTVTQKTSDLINTTMYYWNTTTVSGVAAPQYVLTNVREPKIGTEVYSVSRAITDTIIDSQIIFYGSISAVNDNGSYKVNDTVFNLTYNGTKTKKSYSNEITINIDTDDNKPVYPRITINHGYGATSVPHTVVPLLPHITFSNLVDMQDYVENTVYYNDAKKVYYWKTTEPVWRSESTKPNYDGWNTVEVKRAYTIEDDYANNTFYHYADGNIYYWIDPYSFHSSSNNPNLQTTSIKITNQHYDFFGVASTPITTIVKNNAGTEKIVLDCANKIVSSDRVRRIFGDDFNLQHIELYDGRNEITIDGNCEITLEWREIRKIGEY